MDLVYFKTAGSTQKRAGQVVLFQDLWSRLEAGSAGVFETENCLLNAASDRRMRID